MGDENWSISWLFLVCSTALFFVVKNFVASCDLFVL